MTNTGMIVGHSKKESIAFRGTAEFVLSAMPYANPRLQEIFRINLAPNGLSLVTSAGAIMSVDNKGYLVPCDGALEPVGICSYSLRGTAPMFTAEELKSQEALPEFSQIPSLTKGQLTGLDTLDTLQPTVYFRGVLFERGYAYKKDGVSKALFEFKVSTPIRSITTAEINTCITDETLPVLFGETKEDCAKTKAYYAGMPVVFDNERDKVSQKVGRAGIQRSPWTYNNEVYTNGTYFDMEMQGTSTKGQSYHVWDAIGETYDNNDYAKTILEYYVSL